VIGLGSRVLDLCRILRLTDAGGALRGTLVIGVERWVPEMWGQSITQAQQSSQNQASIPPVKNSF